MASSVKEKTKKSTSNSATAVQTAKSVNTSNVSTVKAVRTPLPRQNEKNPVMDYVESDSETNESVLSSVDSSDQEFSLEKTLLDEVESDTPKRERSKFLKAIQGSSVKRSPKLSKASLKALKDKLAKAKENSPASNALQEMTPTPALPNASVSISSQHLKLTKIVFPFKGLSTASGDHFKIDRVINEAKYFVQAGYDEQTVIAKLKDCFIDYKSVQTSTDGRIIKTIDGFE
jgi:hypothetical protein